MNIFTGETGAGKSILVNAIKLACGQRVKSDIFLKKDNPVNIALTFSNLTDDLCHTLDEYGISGIDQTLIIKRTIMPNGSSRYHINDIPVTHKTIIAIGDQLFEFTGQGSTAKLRDNAYQLELLDGCLESDIVELVKQKYFEYHAFKKKHDALLEENNKNARERDYLDFVRNELENLSAYENEETELLDKIRVLKQHKECSIHFNSIENEIENVRHSLIVLEKSANQLNLPEMIADHSDAIDKMNIYLAELEEAQYKLSKFIENAADYANLEDVEDRLYKIREYSRKYGIPTHELPNFLAEIVQKLNNLQNSAESLEHIRVEIETAKNEYKASAEKLTAERQSAAELLEERLNQDLKQLKLPGMDLKIQLIEESNYTSHGNENVKFLVRSNAGKGFEALSDVVSGGELSRIMLAIKTNVAARSGITYIFDEIDTGISGAVSTTVGQKLATLSKNNQLLVITHQPQVAVFADKHFVVNKSANLDSTTVSVDLLKASKRINEIARMLSGENVTDEAIAAAKKLAG